MCIQQVTLNKRDWTTSSTFGATSSYEGTNHEKAPFSPGKQWILDAIYTRSITIFVRITTSSARAETGSC